MLTRKQTWRRVKPPMTRLHYASLMEKHYYGENFAIFPQKFFTPSVNDMNHLVDITPVIKNSKCAEESNSTECPQEPENPKIDKINNIKSHHSDFITSEILSPVPQSLSFPEIDSVQRSETSSILPLGSSNISLISFTISELEYAPLSEVKTIPPPKAVSFCRTVRVCLVPSRNCLASYCPDLFWSPDDYKTFKDEAIKEIKSVLDARRRVGDKCSPRDVKNALYQPTIYPDLSLSLLAPEEDPLLSEGEQEGVTVVVNLESDFKAEVVHTSSGNRLIGRPAAARTATNIYRGQPTPTQQQYAYPYQLVQYQQHQQYPQEHIRYHPGRVESVLRRVDSVQLFKSHSSSTSSPPRSVSTSSASSNHSGSTTTATGSSSSSNSSSGAGSRRQLDLTVIPAVLA